MVQNTMSMAVGGQLASDDVAFVKSIRLTVAQAIENTTAFDGLTAWIESWEAPEASPIPTGTGCIPTDELPKTLRQDPGDYVDLELGKTFEGTFEDSPEGSHAATTAFVVDEMELAESVGYLASSGQIDKIANEVRHRHSMSETTVGRAVVYIISTLAKGWYAERFITASDRFSKLHVTNDKGGEDAQDTASDDRKPVQIKSTTWYRSRSTKKLEAHSIDFLWYQYNHDGEIVFGYDATDVADEASPYGMSTATSKSTADVAAIRKSKYTATRYDWLDR